MRRKMSEEVQERIIELWKSGMPALKICEVIGFSSNTVYNFLHKSTAGSKPKEHRKATYYPRLDQITQAAEKYQSAIQKISSCNPGDKVNITLDVSDNRYKDIQTLSKTVTQVTDCAIICDRMCITLNDLVSGEVQLIKIAG